MSVVRYWGGTKLGATGLIKAYKTSAEAAINNNQVISKYLIDSFRLEFEYAIMGELLNKLKKLQIDIIHKDLGASPVLKITIRQSQSKLLIDKLKGKLLDISVDRINEKTLVPGLKIEAC